VRIDISMTQSQDPVITIDGTPLESDRGLRQVDAIDLPHTLIFLDRERPYDVEVWINGKLDGAMPAQSSAVDAAYDSRSSD
jgi:hypothetical protein